MDPDPFSQGSLESVNSRLAPPDSPDSPNRMDMHILPPSHQVCLYITVRFSVNLKYTNVTR